MKTRTLLTAALLMVSIFCSAKDIKSVVLSTSPEMHCANCERRIKECLKFEKGIKEISTSLKDKTVTVKYDADKISVDRIKSALAKIDYEATVCPPPADRQSGKKE